jgi:hypothetical protein
MGSDLLAEAYRRYPIGTIFQSIFDDDGAWRKVIPYDEINGLEYEVSDDGKRVRCSAGMKTKALDDSWTCSDPLIYKNGVWRQ